VLRIHRRQALVEMHPGLHGRLVVDCRVDRDAAARRLHTGLLAHLDRRGDIAVGEPGRETPPRTLLLQDLLQRIHRHRPHGSAFGPGHGIAQHLHAARTHNPCLGTDDHLRFGLFDHDRDRQGQDLVHRISDLVGD
ncbi:MAG: hypothetical protein ACK55I_25750, partial [bacterium]